MTSYFERAINAMKAMGTEEYLKSSLTVLKIMQNIMVHPDLEKFRKIRLAASVLCKPGMVELLTVIGFQEQGSYLVYPGTVSSAEQLKPWKQQIVECRKQTGQIEGWDVPGTSLKYSDLLGSGKFGDVYKGYLDSQPVAIKTLKPDCGDLAKAEFDRETRIMSKLHHPNVLGMVALVLTSDPISLVLELMKENMLSVLHQRELSKEEVLHYVSQVSEGMSYLHQQSVLHCDLAARNILLDQTNSVKISDFGLSRVAGTEECNLVGKERQLQFPIRWTAPEVFSKLYVDKKTDVWSFGILFYEFVTAGSVPYAALSNAEVRKQVQEGHRLAQPEECPDSFFRLMQLCWSTDPSKRPSFFEITAQEFPKIRSNAPNQADQKLSVHQDVVAKDRDRSYSVIASPKKQKRIIKIKEPSYSQAIDKGGGVVRVYTALVPPFRHRTVIPCLPKTSVKDAIQMVLVQLGRDYVDPRNYHFVMLCDVTDQPSRFLSANEHIYSLKNCKRQFVLCTHQSVGNEATILDAIMASARDNPAMIKALDPCTRGYLVSQLEVSVKQELDWSRSWVAIDGSTMFTYRDEEDENVKECQHYIDLRNCLCEPVNIKGKQKGTIIRVHKPDGPSYLLQAIDKSEVLRWIDAIQVASTQEPSPRLADVVEGAVVQEGYLEYQEFLLNMVQSADLSQFRQTIQRNLQLSFKQHSSLASNMKVDHGRQWSQLKSNGKMQVFYTGKPETLLELGKATKVKFNHPPALTRSADYSIEVTTTISRVTLKADLPSEHHEWAEVIQHILREQNREDIIQVAEDSTAPNGYVRLKRFMSKKKLQQQSASTLPMETMPEDAQVVTNQDEVAEGLYEDAKFIEHVKSLMPDLKDPGNYSIEPVVAPPLPPRMPSMSNVKPNRAAPVANGRVPMVNGGPPPPMVLPSQSHSSLSQVFGGSPARTVPSRSSSSYSLPATQWARPLTTSFDEIDHHGDLVNHFPRMDQQYLSFNQHRRAVSPVPPMHQLPGPQKYHHDNNMSPTGMSRFDYHAAMEQQQNHVSQQQVQQPYLMGQQVSQQQNHIDQRRSYQYQMDQKPNNGTQQHRMPRQSSPQSNVFQQQQQQQQISQQQQPQHISWQSSPPSNVFQQQQYQHLNQHQMNRGNNQHLERRVSPPYHMGQQFNHVSQSQQQQHHIGQWPNQQQQQQQNVNEHRHSYYSDQQQHHMGQWPNHVSQQQQQQQQQYVSEHRQSYYSDQQQKQHQTASPSSASQYRNNGISHPSSCPNNFPLPPPQPVPEGYIKMHSVNDQLSQPSTTTPIDYVQMNSPAINESPRTYSLNVPTTPPGVEQRPLDTVHKAPQVAPKPSRQPKKSALLSGGTSIEQQVKSAMPPVIPAKKNSLHRRKGLAIYDQTDSNISQQLESTSISSEPRTVPSNAVPPFNAQPKDVSPPVAPVTMPTSNPKTLPPGWFAEMDSSRGQFYYFNRDMGYTTWDIDEVMHIHHENQVGTPGPGWKVVKTPDGRTYFYHVTTRKTTWTIAETMT